MGGVPVRSYIISADLFQSESVPDHIVIHPYLPILQTPISHYCNTLKSPSLQIAIYLCCKMHLALLLHLKGVGQICHRGPQAATGRHTLPNFLARIASNPPEINENQ